ncbi:MAG: hypothetical protein M5U26_14410 [Planctomycetota bacterium]|nr:hypothetical protein [Planctomycetota bacterium]
MSWRQLSLRALFLLFLLASLGLGAYVLVPRYWLEHKLSQTSGDTSFEAWPALRRLLEQQDSCRSELWRLSLEACFKMIGVHDDSLTPLEVEMGFPAAVRGSLGLYPSAGDDSYANEYYFRAVRIGDAWLITELHSEGEVLLRQPVRAAASGAAR